MEINKREFEVRLLFSILLIAGLSYVLRPSIDSKSTLFRALLPLIFGYFCYKRPKDMVFVFWSSIILFAYNFFIVHFISRFPVFDYVFYFYSVVLLFWYFFTKYLVGTATPERVYNFLKNLFKIMLILGVIQFLFGGQYPNTPIRPTEIIIFFPNGNEFSAVLAAFLPLFFLKEKGWKKYIWVFASFFFIIYNDARLSLIATSLFFVTYLIIKLPVFKFGKLGIIFLIITLVSIFFLLKDYEISPGFVLNDLIFTPIKHIVNLDPVEHIGSINSRLNAVIFGTQELMNSYFWGIGLGNSHLMMAEKIIAGTEDGVAHSMHNFMYQIITELGWLGALYLISIFIIVKKNIRFNFKYQNGLIWMFYICMALNITMLSGPFSNYFFLFIFFYSIFYFKYNI